MVLIVLAACSGATSSSGPSSSPGTTVDDTASTGSSPDTDDTPWSGGTWTTSRTWGTGRIYLVPWPPPSGVIEDDAVSTVSGWPESRLGAALRRLPDVDADGVDELYAFAPGPSPVSSRYDAFVLPFESILAGDQPTDAFRALRDVRVWGAVADVTGDGVADLVQPFDANAFPASLAVFDGATLGTPGADLHYDDGVARVETEGTSSNYGWPSGGLGDLDGVPGDEIYVGWVDFAYGGVRASGRVDLYGHAQLDGTSVPTPDDALASIEGRRTGEPWLAAAGGLPDVTGDGLPEVFSSQSEGDFQGVFEAGEIAIVDGATLLAGGAFDYDDAFARIGGAADYDKVGGVAAGLADMDGDGLGELLVGSGQGAVGSRVLLFRGADLAGGGILHPSDAAVIAEGAWLPEVLPDLDGDGVAEIGAWQAEGFVVWSGATVPVAAGGAFTDAATLGAPCTFRDLAAWGYDDGTGVAFLATPTGWVAAFGGSGAM